MFSTSLRGGKAFTAEQKLENLKQEFQTSKVKNQRLHQKK